MAWENAKPGVRGRGRELGGYSAAKLVKIARQIPGYVPSREKWYGKWDLVLLIVEAEFGQDAWHPTAAQ